MIILTYHHGIQRYFRYMYDYDGNGVLDKNDFEVMIKDESYHLEAVRIIFLSSVPGSKKHNHGGKGKLEPRKVSATESSLSRLSIS